MRVEWKRLAPAMGLLWIPFQLHVSWMVVFALLVWVPARSDLASSARDTLSFGGAPALAACALLVLSVLLHEMGHALVALMHGLKIRSITLFVFGGVAQMEKDPMDGWTELKIAASGPAVSLVLAYLFYASTALPVLSEGGRATAWSLASMNLVIAVLNVFPAFPVDGARMLRGLLWRDRGEQRATRIASRAGKLLPLVIVSVGAFRLLAHDGFGALCCALMAWLLKDVAVGAHARVRLHDALRDLAVRDAMLTQMATVPAHLPISDLSARHLLRGGLESCPVVRGERVVGMLVLREALALSPDEQRRTSVQAVMAPLGDGLVARLDEPLLDAMARLTRIGAGPLMVVQDGHLHGMLSIGSILRHSLVREALAS